MSRTVIFDPLVPLPLIWALAAVAVVMLAFAIWRGLRGWPLRGLAMLAVGLALVNPSLQEEDRADLTDIVLLVMDESASQGLADRAAQTAEAVTILKPIVDEQPGNLEALWLMARAVPTSAEAVAICRQILELKPEHVQARHRQPARRGSRDSEPVIHQHGRGRPAESGQPRGRDPGLEPAPGPRADHAASRGRGRDHGCAKEAQHDIARAHHDQPRIEPAAGGHNTLRIRK